MSTSTEHRLAVERRTTTGTNASHALRAGGKIPGILYGHRAEPVALAIDRKAFEDLLIDGGRHQMVTLALDGGSETALIRDVQTAPVGRRVRHVDLQRVSATEEITTTVPVFATGIADGVKNQGGVLDVVLHEISITGPAAELPDHVDVDVSHLAVHGHLTAADVTLPEHVTMHEAPETLIASVEPSKTAETVASDETAAAETAAAEAPAPEPVPELTGDGATESQPS